MLLADEFPRGRSFRFLTKWLYAKFRAMFEQVFPGAPSVVRAVCALFASALSVFSVSGAGAVEPENVDWPIYLGTKERNLYSPLQQIHRGNQWPNWPSRRHALVTP